MLKQIVLVAVFMLNFNIQAKDVCYRDLILENGATICKNKKTKKTDAKFRIKKRISIINKTVKSTEDLWWIHLYGSSEQEYSDKQWNLANS